jgi:hypothetical protein
MTTYAVKFHLGGGWSIECDIEAESQEHAITNARVKLWNKFPQWANTFHPVTVRRIA